MHKKESDKNFDCKHAIRQEVNKLWNDTEKGPEDVNKLVDCIHSIVKLKNLTNLIHTYSFNDPKNRSFDAAIFSSVLKFNENINLIDKREMTVDWNRFDIAKKELFNDKIDWVGLFIKNK